MRSQSGPVSSMMDDVTAGPGTVTGFIAREAILLSMYTRVPPGVQGPPSARSRD